MRENRSTVANTIFMPPLEDCSVLRLTADEYLECVLKGSWELTLEQKSRVGPMKTRLELAFEAAEWYFPNQVALGNWKWPRTHSQKTRPHIRCTSCKFFYSERISVKYVAAQIAIETKEKNVQNI